MCKCDHLTMVRRLFVAAVCAFAVSALPLHAGSTGPFTAGATTGSLHMPQGQDAGTANGDFLSDNDAIAITGPYRYFIEVPAGATKLQVDLYDADIGIDAGESIINRDRNRGDYDSTAVYRLF